MIPEIYRNLYEPDNTTSIRGEETKDSLSRIVHNVFYHEAMNIYDIVQRTPILTHRKDGLPASSSRDSFTDHRHKEASADQIFLYIKALMRLHKSAKEERTKGSDSK